MEPADTLIVRMHKDGLSLMQIRDELNSQYWTTIQIARVIAINSMTIEKDEDKFIVIPSAINFAEGLTWGITNKTNKNEKQKI